MAHTCHPRYVHQRIITFTWTPIPPRLPALFMSLPLVPSPGDIVSVSCLCVVRVSCVVLYYVSFSQSLNVFTPLTCFPAHTLHHATIWFAIVGGCINIPVCLYELCNNVSFYKCKLSVCRPIGYLLNHYSLKLFSIHIIESLLASYMPMICLA
jgi:hypothetical protein